MVLKEEKLLGETLLLRILYKSTLGPWSGRWPARHGSRGLPRGVARWGGGQGGPAVGGDPQERPRAARPGAHGQLGVIGLAAVAQTLQAVAVRGPARPHAVVDHLNGVGGQAHPSYAP